MSEADDCITAADRAALLRRGVAVIEADRVKDQLHLGVVGIRTHALNAIVTGQLGADVEVEVLGDLPRRLQPSWCVGHMEREPRRLQLRYVLSGDDHVDEVLVAEDERTVVVFGTVCTSVAGDRRDACEVPVHVYLERPLGDRIVIDGTRDAVVPYKNVWAEIARDGI